MRRTNIVFIAAIFLAFSTAAVTSQTDNGYRVVHGWPTLPDGFVLGPAAGVAADSKGHVWVFQLGNRIWQEPLSLEPISYPTAIQFNGNNGKVLNVWGA